MSDSQHTDLSALAALAVAALSAFPVNNCQAVTAPAQAQASFKTLDYRETQSGLARMSVQALSTQWTVPLNDNWVLDFGTVVDAISGASPSYYSAPQSFERVTDRRNAQDVRAAYYWRGQRLAYSRAQSRENDYKSQTQALAYAISSEDNNATLDLGVSASNDLITPVNRPALLADKRTHEWLVGGTWVLTPLDLFQAQVTHAQGHGYYSDPYKLLDQRPDHKTQQALVLRWNHRWEQQDLSSRLSWRRAADSFGVRSSTLGAELSKTLVTNWTVTPAVRWYQQTAATFFSAPKPGFPDAPNLPPDYQFGISDLSMDQRLGAFGALTVGIKIERKLSMNSTLDLKYEQYLQRTAWAPRSIPPSLADFRARFIQIGYTHLFDK